MKVNVVFTFLGDNDKTVEKELESEVISALLQAKTVKLPVATSSNSWTSKVATIVGTQVDLSEKTPVVRIEVLEESVKEASSEFFA